MDLPKCKTCKERHRLGAQYCPAMKSSGVVGSPVEDNRSDPTPPRLQEGLATPTTAGTAKRKPRAAKVRDGGNVAKPEKRPESAPPVLPATPEANQKRKRAPAGTFDRNAYQRDLMRKRRAAAKKKKLAAKNE